MDIGKIEKSNFLLRNDKGFTKGGKIFRKHVILKCLHRQKLKKSFRYRKKRYESNITNLQYIWYI